MIKDKKYFLELDFLLKTVHGRLLKKNFHGAIVGVSIDSRKDVKNKLFFALKGLHFDGHDFLNSAFEKGARVFVVSDWGKAQKILDDKKVFVLLVPDTLKALQQLANEWTKFLKTKLIAITGSNGKTTVRSFTHALLANKQAFASYKNYNNFIGVPLSLLSVDRKEAFLIQEIGTSQPGEISFLTSICDPLISVVITVGPSHLEGLGSIESVFREKKEIYLKSPQALWVFNKDNLWTNKMMKELAPSRVKVITFSCHDKQADVSLNFITEDKAQFSRIKGCISSLKFESEVLFSGSHNLENLMCACSLALGAGLDPKEIVNLIPNCRLPKGRQHWFYNKDKELSILFDAYNANPSSMDFFLQSCEKFSTPEKRLLVIGDMRELGKESEKYHKALASHPVVLASCFVAFVGEYAELMEQEIKSRGFQASCVKFKKYDEQLLKAIQMEWKKGDFLGLKASRGLKLENLFFDLTGQNLF